MYSKALQSLNSLLKYDEDYLEGFAKPSHKAIKFAKRALKFLEANEVPCPNDVYCLPDGDVTLEWQEPNGIINRVFFEDDIQACLMTTYPDKDAEFEYFKPKGRNNAEN